jgi:ligand-binding SRPBCC domain-containing protein
MREHIFTEELWLPQLRPTVFAFFADISHLQQITPSFVHLTVLTPGPVQMRVGAVIDHKLRLWGMPIYWRTGISDWNPPIRFVDKQLRGPYRRWIHEHTFEERDGGTLMKDTVRYAVWGGRLVNALFVRRDVKRLFEFRREKLLKLFA